MPQSCGSSDDKAYIVAFASRKFNDTKSKWNIVEKEAHAIISATEKCRHYVLGKPMSPPFKGRLMELILGTKLSLPTELLCSAYLTICCSLCATSTNICLGP